MTREVWLRPNRRPLAFSAVPVGMLLMAGLLIALLAGHQVLGVAGWVLTTAAASAMLTILYRLRLPRLAYEDERLLVFLRGASPIRVPIDVVECFFLGQGPSMLPGSEEKGTERSTETSNVVVRLAEAAEEWKQVEVRPLLGHWCDGYITIRGTWCEPLSGQLLQGLNHKLVVTKRGLRGKDSVAQ